MPRPDPIQGPYYDVGSAHGDDIVCIRLLTADDLDLPHQFPDAAAFVGRKIKPITFDRIDDFRLICAESIFLPVLCRRSPQFRPKLDDQCWLWLAALPGAFELSFVDTFGPLAGFAFVG